MNQWLADLFFALPRALTEPYVFGSLCLAFAWLCYFADIRSPITRAVRSRCGDAFCRANMPRVWQRIFYRAARKKAKLDEGGLYLTNLFSFFLMAMATLIHAALLVLCVQDMAAAVTVDKILLTVTLCIISLLALMTQPAATLDRRTRWGFRHTGNVVRAVLRELLIVAVLFLWLYDAWFLPALL
ncbi:MAG: hypothetical protein IKW66_00895 [Clostridia bacterium]|nr:hypothetical protein [Clostridia bacterium]MBR5798162.1 hypothetical protein [Clostridia bacterium]